MKSLLIAVCFLSSLLLSAPSYACGLPNLEDFADEAEQINPAPRVYTCIFMTLALSTIYMAVNRDYLAPGGNPEPADEDSGSPVLSGVGGDWGKPEAKESMAKAVTKENRAIAH